MLPPCHALYNYLNSPSLQNRVFGLKVEHEINIENPFSERGLESILFLNKKEEETKTDSKGQGLKGTCTFCPVEAMFPSRKLALA